MKKKDKHIMEDIKDTANKQVEKVKDFAKEVETNVNEHLDFKKYSVRIRRMNAKMLNLEAPLYGVFDQVALTMTYRVKDEYSPNELIEISGKMYQVASISNKIVAFPLVIDGEKHDIDCRVAELKPIEVVA